MSSENEVVSQTPVTTETSVDEMKKNAKNVMEQAVAASQKRSLEVSRLSIFGHSCRESQTNSLRL